MIIDVTLIKATKFLYDINNLIPKKTPVYKIKKQISTAQFEQPPKSNPHSNHILQSIQIYTLHIH